MTVSIGTTPRVYVETTVISYLTGRRSQDLLTAAHQQVTLEWWESERHKYELLASQMVVQEAEGGDPQAVQRRLSVVAELTLLEISDEAALFARRLVEEGLIPPEYVNDALHIAVAVVNGVEYLLTWNYRHMASARVRSGVESACRRLGYEPTVICTPEELMEG